MFPIDTVAVMGASEAGGACALAAALACCAAHVLERATAFAARVAESWGTP
jgi:hypothetical protein